MDTAPKQKIGLLTAIIVGMNAMIGAGIFAVPEALARDVGPAGIITYAFVILAVLCMALTLSRVAQEFPEEGSFYAYAKQWGGHTAGIIAAIVYMLGLSIAMGLLTQVAGEYLHTWLPSVSSTLLGSAALIGLIILNMVGVSLSQLGQMILIVCTTFPLIATTILCFMYAKWDNLFPFFPDNPHNLIKATQAVIFGFFGFESAASLYSVVKNPERNVPRALTLAIVFVGIIYLSFVTSIILSIPLTDFTQTNLLLPDILAKNFPRQAWITSFINVSILSAVLGTLHSMIWGSSLFVVSILKTLNIRKSATFRTLSEQNKQRIILVVLGTFILASSLIIKNRDLFFSLTAIGLVISYIMGMGAIFKNKQTTREWITTIIGFFAAGVILAAAINGLVEGLQTLLISAR